MNINLIIKILIGLAGYLVWAVMAYFDPALRADFLHLNMAMVAGTIGLVLRDMQNSGAQPSAQAAPAVQTLVAGELASTAEFAAPTATPKPAPAATIAAPTPLQ